MNIAIDISVPDSESDDQAMDFVQQQNPPVGVEAAEEEMPSYVYTPDGIFDVPYWYIERDRNCPLLISPVVWKNSQKIHGAFTAANLLANTSVRAEHIVVLTLVNPRDPHGRPLRCHWFVRIGVSGGSKYFDEPFGANFLWQLPYASCVNIIQELKAYEIMYNVPPDASSPLIHQLRPTSQDFNAMQWPDLKKLNSVPGYYDKLFAMSVRPCKRSASSVTEQRIPKPPRILRPLKFQEPKSKAFDFAKNVPDDVIYHILKSATSLWLSSPHDSDWKALVSLRAVSKGFKQHVEHESTAFMNRLLAHMQQGLHTGALSDILQARDAVLNSGLMTIPFVLDARDVKFFNLARLRTKRPPGLVPAKPRPSMLTLKRQHSPGVEEIEVPGHEVRKLGEGYAVIKVASDSSERDDARSRRRKVLQLQARVIANGGYY